MSKIQFIDSIRDKLSKYGSPEQAMSQYNSLVQLSSGIYTEEIRFIYELLQNADDSALKSQMDVEIVIDDGSFVFSHNGTPFTDVDVKSICSVGDGGKTSDKNKTGYKGIGFKSVFSHSKDVTITSGEYCFAFSEKEWATYWDESWGNKEAWLTERKKEGKQAIVKMPWQIMPISRNIINHQTYNGFNVKTSLSGVDALKLKQGIGELLANPELLLFLRCEHVHLVVIFCGKTIFDIQKETEDNTIMLFQNKKLVSQWLFHKTPIHIPELVRDQISSDEKTPPKLKEAEYCEISFAIQIEGDKLKETKDSLIYSYLPTSESFNFPFVVNSNFILNAGRQGLIKDSTWNQWLFKQIPIKYMEWVAELANASQYINSLLSIVPDTQYSQNQLQQSFNAGFEVAINEIAFLPNGKGSLLKAKESLFDNTSITSFLPSSMIVDFVAKSTSIKLSEHSLLPVLLGHKTKLKSLGVNFFGLSELEDFFKSEFFQAYHKVEDNFELIKFLYEYVQGLTEEKRSEWNQKLRNIPFIFDESRTLCKPEILFINISSLGLEFENELSFVNSIVLRKLECSETLIQWLADLGVVEPNDISVLEKTLIGEGCLVNLNNALEIGRYVFSLHVKGVLQPPHYSALNNLVLLTKNNELKSAASIFLPSYYKPTFHFEEFDFGFQFVSEDYCREFNKIKDWNYFLCKIGVSDKIEKRKINLSQGMIRDMYANFIVFFDNNKTQIYHAWSGNVWDNTITKYGLESYSCIEYVENYEFSKLFWDNIFKEPYNRESKDIGIASWQDTIYLKENFLEWVFSNASVFPSSQGVCLKASDIFVNSKENKLLAGKYLPVLSCSQPLSEDWLSLISFKNNLFFDDYLFLLSQISLDEENINENKNRIVSIYKKLAENYVYKKDELYAWASKNKLLCIDRQFKSPSELSCVCVSGFEGNHIYSGDETLSEELIVLFRAFGVKVINNIKSNPHGATLSPALKISLITRLPYILFWYEKKKGIKLYIDSLISSIEDMEYYQCEEIKLSYESDGEIIEGGSVRSFTLNSQLYYKDSFDNPVTLLSLAPQLARMLGFDGFVEELKMIIQLSESNIQSYFEELGYDLDAIKNSQEMVKASSLLEVYVTDEADIEQSLGLTDNSDERSRISISQDSKQLILKKLKEKSFIVPESLKMSYTIVEGIKSPDGKPVKLVLKGGKGGKIYFNPSEWLALSEPESQLFVVTRGGIVRNVSLVDLERVNDTFHMRFNTQLFTLSNLPAFANFFKYLPYTHFIFDTPESTTDFMTSFGLNERNATANELTSDELCLID